MKRVRILLLLALFMFNISVVKAEIANATKVSNMYVKIVNTSGVKIYDDLDRLTSNSNVIIPQGVELEVIYINKSNNNYYYVDYNGTKGWIDTSENVSHKEDNYLYTLNNNVDMYKDINNFNTLSVSVDKNKEYKSSYYINLGKDVYYYLDEFSGWVRINSDNNDEDNKLLVKISSSILSISNSNGAKFFNSYVGDDSNGSVADKTIIDYYYTYKVGSTIRYYVKYNDKYGWIDSNDVKSKNNYIAKNKYLYTKDFITAYADSNLTKAVGSIARNQEVEAYTINDNNLTLLYTLEGYWVKYSNDFIVEDNNKYSSSGNFYIYKDNNLNSKKIGGIKEGNEFTELYIIKSNKEDNNDNCILDNWMYIEYNQVKGWIKYKKCEDLIKPMEEISGADIDNLSNDNNDNGKLNEDNNNLNINTNNNKNNIFVIIFLAILLIVVIIMFIVKKRDKSNKKENVVTNI